MKDFTERELIQTIEMMVIANRYMDFLFKQGFAVRLGSNKFEVVRDLPHLQKMFEDERLKEN